LTATIAIGMAALSFNLTPVAMTSLTAQKSLRERLIKNWQDAVDRPTPVIALIASGRDMNAELRTIAGDLGIKFIRLDLRQVITPDQHGLFMQEQPRLVAISGLETISTAERSALVRLLHKRPRTLAVTWCVVETNHSRRIIEARRELAEFDLTRTAREALLLAAEETSFAG
jgi:hypothetical protein